jgi:hypothetical protein
VSAMSTAATVLSILSIVSFAGYLASLLRAPSSGRPKTPVLSRFGEETPPQENPGYKETEEERH